MTLETLSSLSNISLSTLSRIESGVTKKIDIASAVRVAKAFEITIGELIEIAKICDTEEVRQLRQRAETGRQAAKELRESVLG